MRPIASFTRRSDRRGLLAAAALSCLIGAVQAQTGPVEDAEPEHTVASRLAEIGPDARNRLRPFFRGAGVLYPPAAVTLVGLKAERKLEVYAAGPDGELRFIRSYYTRAQSGLAGPKLREGDFQVPEGIYPVTALNPNSAYHVSLRVGYPNNFDRQMAYLDDRVDLGGDIFIHGGWVSAGCLAMGDRVVEEVFVLGADTGIEAINVILSPVDLRNHRPVVRDPSAPWWTPRLYQRIGAALSALPPPRWPEVRSAALKN